MLVQGGPLACGRDVRGVRTENGRGCIGPLSAADQLVPRGTPCRPGRFHLVVGVGCMWSHSAVIMRALKGRVHEKKNAYCCLCGAPQVQRCKSVWGWG